MTPQRIQLSRKKGWRKPEGAVVVARPSIWGNPFRLQKDHAWKDAAWAVLQYGFWIDRLEVFDGYPEPPSAEAIQSLRGKDLCCWCPPDQPCHADVLLALANDPSTMTNILGA